MTDEERDLNAERWGWCERTGCFPVRVPAAAAGAAGNWICRIPGSRSVAVAGLSAADAVDFARNATRVPA